MVSKYLRRVGYGLGKYCFMGYGGLEECNDKRMECKEIRIVGGFLV